MRSRVRTRYRARRRRRRKKISGHLVGVDVARQDAAAEVPIGTDGVDDEADSAGDLLRVGQEVEAEESLARRVREEGEAVFREGRGGNL